jgi:HSP20 family protein
MLVRFRERHPATVAWNLERDIDRIFRAPFGFDCSLPTHGASPVDVASDAEGVTLRAELPGVEPSAIAVSVENRTLTITGKRNEEKRSEGDYLVRERTYGEFSHAFRLSDDLDSGAITADCKDGVLTLRIPKRAAVQPRQIEVKTS